MASLAGRYLQQHVVKGVTSFERLISTSSVLSVRKDVHIPAIPSTRKSNLAAECRERGVSLLRDPQLNKVIISRNYVV